MKNLLDPSPGSVSQLARSRHQAVAQRERLTRLLNLAGEQLKFQLPSKDVEVQVRKPGGHAGH